MWRTTMRAWATGPRGRHPWPPCRRREPRGDHCRLPISRRWRYRGGARGESEKRMSELATVREIERAIGKLSPEDLAAFRIWFSKFDAEAWDRSYEEDVTAGRLDWL